MKLNSKWWNLLGILLVCTFMVSVASGAEDHSANSENTALEDFSLIAVVDRDADDEDDEDDEDEDDDGDNDNDDGDNDDGDNDDGDEDEDEDDDDDEDSDVFSWQRAPEYRALSKADKSFSTQTYQLLRAYNKATEEARPALRDKLQKLVAEHFRVRQARRQYELKILQEQVQKLQAENDYRNKNAETIIQKHVDFLLQQDDGQRF